MEDEGLIAADIQQRLECLGYSVPAIAKSGEEALRCARSTPFDLVLMDVRIVGAMDGIATAAALKAEFGTPVVYVTGHSDQDTVTRAMLTEPFGYIVKPFGDANLRSAVQITVGLDARSVSGGGGGTRYGGDDGGGEECAAVHYSRFCDLYRSWLRRQEVVLRQEHRAGEKLFVDFAGDTIPVHPAAACERTPAQIFVAVLGASNYTYAEATATQGLADWICNLDSQPIEPAAEPKPPLDHPNIRGSEYFDNGGDPTDQER